MSQDQCVCIILARGGSKGVPHKNLRKIGGVSLVGRSVLAARRSRVIDQTYVSTDDQKIAEEARRFGAKVIDRPETISGDTATSEEGWLHALEFLSHSGESISTAVFLQCTSPFTTGSEIDACVSDMKEKGADCALSVHEDHSFIWHLEDNGFGKGTNHLHLNQRKRRQDMRPSFCETGAIYVVDAAQFRVQKNRFFGKVALFEVDHPRIEIDTLDDLLLCRQVALSSPKYIERQFPLERVKVLIMDFDGVHTDDKVHVDQHGVESVTTSRSDGMGIANLHKNSAIKTLIVSKERNPVVLKRAEKLGIEVYGSVDDKVEAISTWLEGFGAEWSEVLYLGNDVNDIGPLDQAGLAACPQDAHPTVLEHVDWVVPANGGNGVVRMVSDFLVSAQLDG